MNRKLLLKKVFRNMRLCSSLFACYLGFNKSAQPLPWIWSLGATFCGTASQSQTLRSCSTAWAVPTSIIVVAISTVSSKELARPSRVRRYRSRSRAIARPICCRVHA